MSYDKGGEFKGVGFDLYLRRSDSFPEYWLMSLTAYDLNEHWPEQGYVWFIAHRDQARQVSLWVPNADTLKELVRSGVIHGEVNWKMGGSEVLLDELTVEDLELIASHDSVISATRSSFDSGSLGRPLFLWNRPLVFIRQ